MTDLKALYDQFRDAKPDTPEYHHYWELLLSALCGENPEESGNASNSQPVGKQSIEHLYHFQCGSCRKWWTIGDAPAIRYGWYCPWCGLFQKVEISPKA